MIRKEAVSLATVEGGKRKGDCTRTPRTHGAESYMERKSTVFTNNTLRGGAHGGWGGAEERGGSQIEK